MDDSVIFILGTSRSNGNTSKLVERLNEGRDAMVVNLSDHKVAPYDYEYRNSGDDFLELVSRILLRKTIVFATPVYWYAMSAQLKTFVDRFSDLIRVDKRSGRALAGRRTFLATSGTDERLPPGYEEPFRLTSQYLNMEYCGSFYAQIRTDLIIEDETVERVPGFASRIFHL